MQAMLITVLNYDLLFEHLSPTIFAVRRDLLGDHVFRLEKIIETRTCFGEI